MPTPIEILFDPISLGILTLYGLMIMAETFLQGDNLPKVKGWLPRATFVFVVYFYLSSYLPLIWDQYLISYRIFDLSGLGLYFGGLVGLLIFEFFIYVWHRTMHKAHWLWLSFHQMHHSAERLDSYGAFYFSPLDIVGFTFIGSISALLIGLSPQATTLLLFASLFLGIFQHLNISTPQWLGYIIQRPESHSVHHCKGIHAFNYSDLPLFDIIFGTFKNPKEFVEQTGFYNGASKRIPEILMFKDVSHKSNRLL